MSLSRSKAEWLDAWLAQLATQRKLSPHTLDAYGRDQAHSVVHRQGFRQGF